MYKKSLLVLSIIFAILFICTISLATAQSNAKNAVSSATNTVVDGAVNLANDVRSGVGSVENGIEDVFTGNDNRSATRDDNVTRNTTNGNYTTARVAGTTTGTGADTTTMWIWIILAIAAIIIVGLIWYYGSQNRVE